MKFLNQNQFDSELSLPNKGSIKLSKSKLDKDMLIKKRLFFI